MKVYVVTAGYCEDTSVCGVALDYETAEKIYDCEKNKGGIRPDWVSIDEYETDQYLQLNEGLKPFEVIRYQEGHQEGLLEAVPASLENFNHGQVYNNSVRCGRKCIVCDLYAKDEGHAVELAFDLYNKNLLSETSE